MAAIATTAGMETGIEETETGMNQGGMGTGTAAIGKEEEEETDTAAVEGGTTSVNTGVLVEMMTEGGTTVVTRNTEVTADVP